MIFPTFISSCQKNTLLLLLLLLLLLQLSCHSVAEVPTLVQAKQIIINIHKRKNTKHSTNNTKHSIYQYTYYQNTNTLAAAKTCLFQECIFTVATQLHITIPRKFSSFVTASVVQVVSILATGTRVRRFKPGPSRWIFRASGKSSVCLPSGGK